MPGRPSARPYATVVDGRYGGYGQLPWSPELRQTSWRGCFALTRRVGREWLDRHQPAPAERVNWWLYLLLAIGFQIAGQPAQHREWVRLSFWLLDAGHLRGVLTDVHYAEKRAYFALDMRRTAAIDADLPSADDIVRALPASDARQPGTRSYPATWAGPGQHRRRLANSITPGEEPGQRRSVAPRPGCRRTCGRHCRQWQPATPARR